jgi:hypothetical protein
MDVVNIAPGVSADELVREFPDGGEKRVQPGTVETLICYHTRKEHELGSRNGVSVQALYRSLAECRKNCALSDVRVDFAGELIRSRTYIGNESDDFAGITIRAKAPLNGLAEGCRYQGRITSPGLGTVEGTEQLPVQIHVIDQQRTQGRYLIIGHCHGQLLFDRSP